MQHPELTVLLWSAGLIAVFAPLAVWLYRRKVHQPASSERNGSRAQHLDPVDVPGAVVRGSADEKSPP